MPRRFQLDSFLGHVSFDILCHVLTTLFCLRSTVFCCCSRRLCLHVRAIAVVAIRVLAMAEGGRNSRDVEAGESANSSSVSTSEVATLGSHQWPTVDGPLGVYHEEAVKLSKRFFYAGFLLLPWLWFINCFYFWPVLRNPGSDPLIRPYVVKSGIGFLACSSLLLAWALTFAYGGEDLFGDSWKSLAVYDIAYKYAQIIT